MHRLKNSQHTKIIILLHLWIFQPPIHEVMSPLETWHHRIYIIRSMTVASQTISSAMKNLCKKESNLAGNSRKCSAILWAGYSVRQPWQSRSSHDQTWSDRTETDKKANPKHPDNLGLCRPGQPVVVGVQVSHVVVVVTMMTVALRLFAVKTLCTELCCHALHLDRQPVGKNSRNVTT